MFELLVQDYVSTYGERAVLVFKVFLRGQLEYSDT